MSIIFNPGKNILFPNYNTGIMRLLNYDENNKSALLWCAASQQIARTLVIGGKMKAEDMVIHSLSGPVQHFLTSSFPVRLLRLTGVLNWF